jgi:hypothetical protein
VRSNRINKPLGCFFSTIPHVGSSPKDPSASCFSNNHKKTYDNININIYIIIIII